MQIGMKSMPTVFQKSFSQVPQVKAPQSEFRRVFKHGTTMNADYLVPFFWSIAYPGDRIKFNTSFIARLATPETPFMDNLYMHLEFFACPIRLLQTNFVKMHGEQTDPADSIDYSTPKLSAPVTTGYSTPTDWTAPTTSQLAGALQDYLGVPPGVGSLTHHNYCGRMYNLMWNQFYRDQNLQDSLVVDLDDGPDSRTDYILKKRAKPHDYFTSCLPWIIKGGTSQALPLGTSAPIATDATNTTDYLGVVSTTQSDAEKRLRDGGAGLFINTTASTSGAALYADLTTATAATIDQLYEAFALQALLQQDARGGTRYNELVASHFQVTNNDARFQRVEYCGGKKIPFMVSPLAQTSETATTELGTLGATVTAMGDGAGFIKGITEHSIVMGVASVTSDITYQQGLHREFSLDTRFDFYYPALANLSEMPVLNKEIYAVGDAGSTDDDVFGYQERWAELRYGKSQLSGRMRSADAASLDVWHLSEEFSSLPSLNDAFIQNNTSGPLERVIAVTSEPHFKVDFYSDSTWARVLPTYSMPGLQNRF